MWVFVLRGVAPKYGYSGDQQAFLHRAGCDFSRVLLVLALFCDQYLHDMPRLFLDTARLVTDRVNRKRSLVGSVGRAPTILPNMEVTMLPRIDT